MKLIDQINGSALFAQSAFSASTATKDSLGRDITATYLTGVNIPESATWNETSNVVSSNSAQWSQGKTYEGVSPIVVNNNESKISADTWTLSAGDGISFTDDSANKVTRIDVTAQGGDEGVNSFVHDNSATIIDVNSSYQSNSATWNEVSAKVDTTALIPTIDSNTISYSSKPTDNPIYASKNELGNVDSIQGKSNLAIVPSGVLQVPNVITAAQSVLQVPNAITATNGNLIVQNAISAIPNNTLDVPGIITANQGGLTANGLSANTNNGLTANGLTADALHSSFSAIGISAGKQGPFIIQGSHESISSNNEVGFVFSSDNTNFNSAILTTAGNNNIVGMPAPMFEARNISGAGFSIEASGAKGYDKSGNVVWDTSNPQVKNIISYSDTKTAQGGLNGNIILTTQPSTNASNLTSSPYVIMDANQASYFAAYGPSAQTPTVKMAPDSITFAYPVGNSGKTTVGYNDIKQECSGSSWTLTGSIQKRELEYDASTSAITAINGSALAGQGGGAISSYTTDWCYDVPPYGDNVINSLNGKYLSAFISNSADKANEAINANSAKSANYAETVNETYVENKGFTRNLSSEYGTISVIHNHIIESTNSAISRTGNEGFVSAFEDNTIGPSADYGTKNFSWDKSLPNTMFNFSTHGVPTGTIVTYSANTNLTGEVTVTSNNLESPFSVEVPNATELNVWCTDWTRVVNIVASAADSFETVVGELAWASALPSYEYDSANKISAINGSALAGGSDIPSGTMNVSGLEYNAVNEISGYNGSAIAQYGAEKQWLVHDDTLVHASNSAQYALGVNISALQRLMGIDETVLWSGSLTSAFSLSESMSSFNKVRFVMHCDNANTQMNQNLIHDIEWNNGNIVTMADVVRYPSTSNYPIYDYRWGANIASNGKDISNVYHEMYWHAKDSLTGGGLDDNAAYYPVKVIGIGRKS